jgi:hypothetical protein
VSRLPLQAEAAVREVLRRHWRSYESHHGCGLSFDVTTKLVRSVWHWLHRNRRWTSGTPGADRRGSG